MQSHDAKHWKRSTCRSISFRSHEFLTTVPFGGGYYYISPIPNRRVADIGQQFFMKTLHHHFAPYLPKQFKFTKNAANETSVTSVTTELSSCEK